MKKISLIVAILFCVSTFAFAQPPNMGNPEDFGMPKSNFPVPPFAESATAIVNLNLDYMDLNPGYTLLHRDVATEVKLIAFVRAKTKVYSLKAMLPDSTLIPIKIEESEETPGCLFAMIGTDWVNTICSQNFFYHPDAETNENVRPRKVMTGIEMEKKETMEKSVLSKIQDYESQKGKKDKKKKKKGKKKKKKRK